MNDNQPRAVLGDRFVIERVNDPRRPAAHYLVLDLSLHSYQEGYIVGHFDTPADAMLKIQELTAPAETVAEEITNDPHEKLRRSLAFIRKKIVEEAAASHDEDLANAIVDVAAMFILSQNQTAVQLERIANAVIAQTKMLCMVYSNTVSEKGIADVVQTLKE